VTEAAHGITSLHRCAMHYSCKSSHLVVQGSKRVHHCPTERGGQMGGISDAMALEGS
jgi:hypothetical protein